MTSGEALKQFRDEVPALGLLGTQHFVHPEKPFTVDNDVQLVCKYLKALQLGGRKGIDRLYREGYSNYTHSSSQTFCSSCMSLIIVWTIVTVETTHICLCIPCCQ